MLSDTEPLYNAGLQRYLTSPKLGQVLAVFPASSTFHQVIHKAAISGFSTGKNFSAFGLPVGDENLGAWSIPPKR